MRVFQYGSRQQRRCPCEYRAVSLEPRHGMVTCGGGPDVCSEDGISDAKPSRDRAGTTVRRRAEDLCRPSRRSSRNAGKIVHQSLIPYLSTRVKDSFITHLTLRTTGIAESLLASRLGDLDELLHGVTLAFLPSPRGVRLRISARSRTREQADQLVHAAETRIRAKVEKYIYATGDEELEEVIGGSSPKENSHSRSRNPVRAVCSHTRSPT